LGTKITCGNNNVIIVNSSLTDSDIIQKTKNTKQERFNRESIIKDIENFAKSHNQSNEWIKTFAKEFLGIIYNSCDELTIIQLVNIQKSLEYYI